MAFFDLTRQVEIDPSSASCDMEKWKNESSAYPCCKHPDGFFIFLPPQHIEVSDEYAEGDPYTVINNLETNFQQRRLNCTIDLIRSLDNTANLKILDVGCGEGHITNAIKETFPTSTVYGLDYSVSAIRYANSRFEDINFVVANAYEPPYTNSTFDVVICNNLWEHVSDPLTLLRSIGRVLKPNGVVIISTPSRYRLSNIINLLRGRGVKFMSKLHVTEYTVGQVKEQLRFGGYTPLKAYSPRINERKKLLNVFKSLLGAGMKIFKSDHILESTVFYAARKNVDSSLN